MSGLAMGEQPGLDTTFTKVGESQYTVVIEV